MPRKTSGKPGQRGQDDADQADDHEEGGDAIKQHLGGHLESCRTVWMGG
jgi:hypothetical protein